MSISQESAASIVCREVFDETSHPSNEEVLDYARRLGIDPDAEPHLLDLARKGLMAALPKGWLPCFHEASGSWYYYQASTGTTTWEHPLDSVHKAMVEQVRAGNARQMSLEEDSKTTTKDLESHEEATLPKESSSSKETLKQSARSSTVTTKIPTKLTPLKKLEKIDGGRRKDGTGQERQFKRDDAKIDNPLANNRAARDYTNLKFQDPKFYECPKLLEIAASTSAADTPTATTPKQEIDLKEVLKRSESLSPRHEKDWEQLSSKFSSEENIIDIDKLSVTTLAKSEKSEKFDKEKHPSQFGQQKELTISGGGTMFLKSNRSRDTTPSHEGSKMDDFRTVVIPDEGINVGGDKLKSILREKQSEDDDRPVDEERKSVRFDIEKEVDIKFTYSGSEDDWESESEEQNVQMTAVIANKDAGWAHTSQKTNNQSFNDETKVDVESKPEEDLKKSTSLEKVEPLKKNAKIVGKRFIVQNVPESEHRPRFVLQNVSEKEHRLQMARDSLSKESLSRESSPDFTSTSKFNKIKNIDLVSKSETDCTDSEVRRKNRPKVEFEKDEQTDDDTSHSSRVNQKYEMSRKKRYESTAKQEQSKKLDETKTRLSLEHHRDIDALQKEFEDKLGQTKKDLEANFTEQKKQLEKNLCDKLEELKREMAEKEEREIQKLIAEMNEARIKNRKKVKAELEMCYEKEGQEILANLKTELDERRRELLELRNQEIGKLEDEHERDLGEEKRAKLSEIELTKQHSEKLEAMKKELEKEYEDLRTQLRLQQREKIARITDDHERRLTELLRDFRMNEDLTREMYKQRLEEIRADLTQDVEKETRKRTERALQQDSMEFEKMRCEKRLLQEKYVALKEKYLKLKRQFRSAIEKRRRMEGYTTASETERSASTRTRTERTESSEQNTPLRNPRSSSAATNPKPHEIQPSVLPEEPHEQPEETSVQKANTGFPKSVAVAKTAARFETDDTTTASETNANLTKKKKNFTKKATATNRPSTTAGNNHNNNNNNLENPVENIRKQLEKLEDLGDQLPSNETAYTLRYPFQDKAPANASSELEFFRHRIHVERDSVRRAREALRHQENVFQGRQRVWKQRSARATLEQLVQEERELSDMEVNLHRTKSLLGEKVIYLRHLEQSLERVANAKRNENDATTTKNDELTLSDLSSVSSGFSSTDLETDMFIGTFGTPHILSNILSELKATQPSTITMQNIIAQYGPNSGFTTSVGTVEKSSSNLMERTWNLRDWLRQARIENTDLMNPGQATL